jgi:hypothetical protein
LDCKRKGAIVLESLKYLLGTKKVSNSYDKKTDPIKNFSNIIKVLKATFHLMEDHKRRYNITTEYLK